MLSTPSKASRDPHNRAANCDFSRRDHRAATGDLPPRLPLDLPPATGTPAGHPRCKCVAAVACLAPVRFRSVAGEPAVDPHLYALVRGARGLTDLLTAADKCEADHLEPAPIQPWHRATRESSLDESPPTEVGEGALGLRAY